MEIPYLALSKQIVLAAFSVMFTLLVITIWTSDVNKHAGMPLEGGESDHG